MLYQSFPKEPLPAAKLIVDLVQVLLPKFTLLVDVDCPEKKARALFHEDAANVLKDVKVTIRQREAVTVENYNKNSIIIKSVSLFNTEQVMSPPAEEEKPKEGRKHAVVKLFTATNYTNEHGQTTFADLLSQLNNYELEVSGDRIKSTSSFLQVSEMIDHHTQTIKMSIRVERADLVKCYLQVVNQGSPISDCHFKVSADP